MSYTIAECTGKEELQLFLDGHVAVQITNAESAGQKRKSPSRLGRKLGKKAKVDRLNILFEAIEADKASDSENASANFESNIFNQGPGEDEVQAHAGGTHQQPSNEAQLQQVNPHTAAAGSVMPAAKAAGASALPHEAQQATAGMPTNSLRS